VVTATVGVLADRPASAGPLTGVLVVIPAFNESGSITSVIREVRATLPGAGILVVNDGSEDATAEVSAQEGVEVLRLPFNLGVGGAMRAGFLYATEHRWHTVVQIDADGQHDPAYVPAMLAELAHGADIVVGARFAGVGDYRAPFLRRLTMRLVSRVMSRICATRMTDATSGLRAANHTAVELFARCYPAEYLGDTLQSLVIARRADLVVRQIPVEMRARVAGRPSQGFLGSILYLLRCAFALAVRKQSAPERRWLSRQVAHS